LDNPRVVLAINGKHTPSAKFFFGLVYILYQRLTIKDGGLTIQNWFVFFRMQFHGFNHNIMGFFMVIYIMGFSLQET
jgi:hypothetical protein